jgi:2-amino-4-hydroxy-6-hydroxymethyldihydropteridine diphosphokinase
MTEAALGLGANLGDREASILRALELLCEGGAARVIARSPLYETAPWGDLDQGPFLNACALIETSLEPLPLLAHCLGVESALGRDRKTGRRWGPRMIDIDVLYFGDVVADAPALTLPHPRMMERAFVLAPLTDIAPDKIIGGRRVADALADIGAEGVTRWTGAS